MDASHSSEGGWAAGAGLWRTRPQPRRHRCEATCVGYALAPDRAATMTGRGAWRQDGAVRRVETIAPSSPFPGSARRQRAQCADGFFAVAPVPVGAASVTSGGIEPMSTRRARWRAPPWGTQRRSRHRRMTTVSSTSSFRRRLCRRLLRGCQAAGRGTTLNADRAARRAASAPSPPQQHSTRALSAIGPCCGHKLARPWSPSASPP
jgi:hypothetical protein